MIRWAGSPSNMRSRGREAIVAQSAQVLLAKAEEVGGEEGRPLADAIDRLAGHEEIGEEDEQGSHGRQFGPRVVPGEMFAENALATASARLDSLEQGEGPDVIRTELEAVGLSVFTRDDLAFGACARETSDRGRDSVRALRITPRITRGNRRTCDQGTKRGEGSSRWKKVAEFMLLEL